MQGGGAHVSYPLRAVTRRRKATLAAMLCAALLLGWEGLARALGVAECQPPTPATGTWPEMQADARYLWRLTPGYVIRSGDGSSTTIGPLGLRDTLTVRPKLPNEVRILTTGDSSVYGWGVPDGRTYQELLERRLNQRFPGSRIEVVNLGVPGYSTVQTLRLLEDVGWALEPDLVVVSNIFSDCNIDVFQDETALALVRPPTVGLTATLHRSRTYCAAWNVYANRYASSNQERNRVLMPGIPRDTSWLETVDRVVDQSRVPLDDYLRNIDAIEVAAAAHGARVVLAPLAQEWDVGRWTVRGMPKPSEGTTLQWTPYRAALAAYAEARSVPFLPFYEAFAAVPRDRAMRLFNDPIHPSSDGAAVMADALFTLLERRPDLWGGGR